MSAPTVPTRARMTVAPGPRAVMVAEVPDEATDAIAELSEVQAIVADVRAVPFASRAVPVTACVPPIAVNVTLPTDTSTRDTGPGPVGPSPPPPHAASAPSTSTYGIATPKREVEWARERVWVREESNIVG